MNYFRMSTSTLNSPHVKLGGFGPVVPDGYALGYMVYDVGEEGASRIHCLL